VIAIKNHMMVDGQLLQMNKKWSALKEAQKEKISRWLKEATAEYRKEYGHYPASEACYDVVDAVYEKIQTAGIWIPYDEVYDHYISKKQKMINKLEKAEKEADSKTE